MPSKPSSESAPRSPLPMLDDLMKYAQNLKLPGFDVSALVESQRKDIEALTEANRTAYEGLQALAQRQAEMLRDSVQRLQAMAASGNDMTKGAEQVRAAMQQAMDDFRELASMEAESRGKAWGVLQKRFEENMANVQKLLRP